MPANKIKYKLSNTYTSLLDLIYPIGALYISAEKTSPATLFGGTWAQITDGAALRAANGYGLTGSDSCTLTSSQIPDHMHFVGTFSDTIYTYSFIDNTSNRQKYMGTYYSTNPGNAL